MTSRTPRERLPFVNFRFGVHWDISKSFQQKLFQTRVTYVMAKENKVKHRQKMWGLRNSTENKISPALLFS